MRVFHDSRVQTFREPFGAVPAGTAVRLRVDVWEDPDVQCVCRLWMDQEGERLVEMGREETQGRVTFTCQLQTARPQIIWYSFLLTASDGRIYRYGAQEGRTGGEGALYDREPPSFQLTVYAPRPLPEWYRNGLVYQIFPDRYRRGADWRTLAADALNKPKNGPARRLVEEWDTVPSYEKDAEGRVTVWDFYGGTLSGIREDLDRLRRMGITVIYLTPIFQAASNHRYDTGDYAHVDEMLGGDEAFALLAQEAEQKGISIILDGVFNHTGCDSRYFNKYGNYDTLGAFQSPQSPYRGWYSFDDSSAGYACWWGVDDLPALRESAPGVRELILGRNQGVIQKWLQAGAKGWRLDVADELSDAFIRAIKTAALEVLGRDALVLGEVWEDASNKISYGRLRQYLLGSELDGVMNYPLRDGVLGFLLGETSASDLREVVMRLLENYPRQALFGGLNLLGSHDRPRLLTVLGQAPPADCLNQTEQRDYRLSPEQRALAKSRAWLAVLIQMTLPGVPCIYYGDEAGMEGYTDPYNRGPYPWGREDRDMQTIYRNAIALRRLSPMFVDGDLEPFAWDEDVFGFFREAGPDRCAVLVNRSVYQTHSVDLPAKGTCLGEIISGQKLATQDGTVRVVLPPMGSAAVLFRERAEGWGKPLLRGTGVLCHVTSLPNDAGRGNIGEPGKRFVDFLARTGQTYWQLLPLNPTDAYGSPYAGTSAFAANIGLLPQEEQDLRAAWANFSDEGELEEFRQKNRAWLEPYAWFTALKQKYGGLDWRLWPSEDRSWPPASMDSSQDAAEADFQIFCQYCFHRQWTELRAYADARGVRLIGDLPMYVSADSADVWANRELFTLDEDGGLRACAGVPPDGFSDEGQHWGMPLFDWERMKQDGYTWWLRRLERAFALYDYVRLDHFRGYESYWEIPGGEPPAKGEWVPGPGLALFEAAYKRFGPLPILAEDLGVLTPAVRGLVKLCGFPGMDVLQFADGDPLGDYAPAEGAVAYTGTHDNQTLTGWCRARYPDLDPRTTADALMERLYHSRADVRILPLQDLLGLGDEARMNTPGTTVGNWTWQAGTEDLAKAADRLRALAQGGIEPRQTGA